MITMEVEFAGETYTVEQDQTFIIGRTGDLAIDDNPYLHRSFLELTHEDGFWWVANVGNRVVTTLLDEERSTQMVLGPGARVPLVFRTAVLTFNVGGFTYELNLEASGLAFDRATAPDVASGDTTIGGTSFTASQLLAILALAEPVLRRAGTGVWQIPTAVQAAARLGWSQTRFNRKLDNVCDKLDRVGVRGLRGGPGKPATNRRANLVEYAVNARIVTAEQLSALDAESGANVGRTLP